MDKQSTNYQAIISDLAMLFDELRGAPGVHPFDLQKLYSWADSRDEHTREIVAFVHNFIRDDVIPLTVSEMKPWGQEAYVAWIMSPRAASIGGINQQLCEMAKVMNAALPRNPARAKMLAGLEMAAHYGVRCVCMADLEEVTNPELVQVRITSPIVYALYGEMLTGESIQTLERGLAEKLIELGCAERLS